MAANELIALFDPSCNPKSQINSIVADQVGM